MNNIDEMPLTFTQRARLLIECLPVVFFSLALVFVLHALADLPALRRRSFLFSFYVLSFWWWDGLHLMPYATYYPVLRWYRKIRLSSPGAQAEHPDLGRSMGGLAS